MMNEQNEFQYKAPLIAKLLHSLPHYNITFHRTNDTFRPTDEVYLEVNAFSFVEILIFNENFLCLFIFIHSLFFFFLFVFHFLLLSFICSFFVVVYMTHWYIYCTFRVLVYWDQRQPLYSSFHYLDYYCICWHDVVIESHVLLIP